MKLLGSFFLGLVLVAVSGSSGLGEGGGRGDSILRVNDLRCEYRVNPLGIDAAHPRLSWILESPKRGQKQTAYQIIVSVREEELTTGVRCLWDSGKIESNQTIQVVYRGPPLKSQQRYYWKVRVWDRRGQVSGWGATAWWETGLLSPKEWTACWITDGKSNPERDEEFYEDDPGPLFRKEFQVDKPVRRARLYVSGLGYYEARLNGNRVGDCLLDPAWTTYSDRILYNTYDVTDQLCSGRNCLGAMLGNGWYNVLPLRMWGQLNLRPFLTSGRPRLIAQLNIEYSDGTRQVVMTDESWKISDGPVIRNSVYLGEVYDARKEQVGWDRPGFDDTTWGTAKSATESLGALEAQSQPPIRQTVRLKPVKVSQPKKGVSLFDFGQNFAGWVTLRVMGPAGTKVKLRYGELLHDDGMLNAMTTVCGQIKEPGKGGPGAPPVAEQRDIYILKGEGNEVYTPRFTYHGFRYVEVTGYPGTPTLDAIDGVRLNTTVAETGAFSCSNDLFNRIQRMARRTFPSNLMGVQTDCPARERFGYGDDIACAAEAHLYNYDMATFYTKTVRDFADAARSGGALTLLAPWTGHAIGGFDPGGGNFADMDGGSDVGTGAISGVIAHPLLIDKLYQYYGDRRLLEEHYETARRSLEFIRSQAENHIITVGLGDWSSVEPTTAALLSTAFYYHHVEIVSRLAEILGHEEDARQYTSLVQEIKGAFIRRFLKPATGQFDAHTQAAQAFALYYDLVPPDERQAAIGILLDDILVDHQGHLTTGIFGTKYLLDVLTRIGRADVAHTIVNQKTYPGWGFMLDKGATTLWEVWHFSDDVYSHNHSMFGTVSAWFFSALAGIQPDPEAVGFDKIIIKPQVVGELTWVDGAYRSIRGKIVSRWRLDRGLFHLNVVIPANTTATVHVPTTDADRVTEGGRPASAAEGVRFVRMEDGAAVYRIGSGNYSFTAKTAKGMGAVTSSTWDEKRNAARWRRRRLIFNNDGDDVFSPMPKTPEAFLASRTTPLLGSQVDSIFYCTGRTTTLWHDTQVGYFLNTGSAKRLLTEYGRDCLQIQVDFCRKNGVEIFWSMRMNDIHDSYLNSPPLASAETARSLFSSFKRDHPEYLMGKPVDSTDYPMQSVRILWSALNYTVPEVRNHLFRIVQEVCREYDIDGVELDFQRTPVFFPPTLEMLPVAQNHLDTMTGLVRCIRNMTIETGLKRGRPLLVAARVPMTVERSRFIGLDVERWLREDLVDILIDGDGYLPMAMPTREMVRLGHQYNVPVYPCITNCAMLKGGFWGSGRGPDLLDFSSLRAWRGAAMNIWNSGADGIYLFNCFNPKSEIWRELGDPGILAKKDKIYAVDYLNRGASLGEAKTVYPTEGFVPMALKLAEAIGVDLPVGEDLQPDNLSGLKLYLHLSQATSKDGILVKLNGAVLSKFRLTDGWLEFPLNATQIKRGDNKIEVTLSKQKGLVQSPLLLDGVQLLVRYQ